MKTQSLNGVWKYRVGKGREINKEVPFSALCVGHSECRKVFDLEHISDTVLLKFDGITCNATVTLNGIMLGKMLPYSEYIFDISDIAKETNNELLVELEDITPPFGPSEGWENYGGIIRDVSLLYKNENYITDVFFIPNLTDNCKNGQYTLNVSTKSNKGEISVELSYNGEIVENFQTSVDKKVTRELKNIRTWSPKFPNLYKLTVKLVENYVVVDNYECNVGFREFKCNSHKFLLNGEPVFFERRLQTRNVW